MSYFYPFYLFVYFFSAHAKNTPPPRKRYFVPRYSISGTQGRKSAFLSHVGGTESAVSFPRGLERAHEKHEIPLFSTTNSLSRPARERKAFLGPRAWKEYVFYRNLRLAQKGVLILPLGQKSLFDPRAERPLVFSTQNRGPWVEKY